MSVFQDAPCQTPIGIPPGRAKAIVKTIVNKTRRVFMGRVIQRKNCQDFEHQPQSKGIFEIF